jgi:hypothetical protein
MVLNGLGFSNRQLYVMPQYFANKLVEHLLGPGMSAEMHNVNCLGLVRGWLYDHDLTKLFADSRPGASHLWDQDGASETVGHLLMFNRSQFFERRLLRRC